MNRSLVSLIVGAFALSGCASLAPEPSGCPSQSDVAALTAAFVALKPVPNPPADLSAAAAICGRDKFNQQLGQHFGRVVGYKAGLTNPAVQKRFNHPSPVRGTLYEKMLLADGASVPAQFGARPLFEADMVVEVKSAAIHDARTPAEVLAQLNNVRPFIELPDLVVQDPSKIGGPAINYINVGARLGVLGAPVVLAPTPANVQALAAMSVKLVDGDGKVIDAGKGSDILDHPLNAVIWLAADLKRSGITLRPGDLLSLGSFSRLMPPKAGLQVRAVYEGLPGNPSVSVSFR